MSTELEVQYTVDASQLPSCDDLQSWVDTALKEYSQRFSICIRIVDADESQALNSQYRGKERPTNVLSFPFETPDCVTQQVEILGDLLICAPVVAQEAIEQQKTLFDHWAHMTIHGTLHLLGFDHIEDGEAEEMEQLEKDILAKLDICDPYL